MRLRVLLFFGENGYGYVGLMLLTQTMRFPNREDLRSDEAGEGILWAGKALLWAKKECRAQDDVNDVTTEMQESSAIRRIPLLDQTTVLRRFIDGLASSE